MITFVSALRILSNVLFILTYQIFLLETDATRTAAYQAHNVSQFWYKERLSREDGKMRHLIEVPSTVCS